MTAKIIPIGREEPKRTENELSDEALLAACATGDRAALGILFDRHAARVRSFIAHLDPREDNELDDVVQATFEAVQTCARRFEARSEVRTWILGIARNVMRHERRTRLKQKRIAVALVTEPRPAADLTDERFQHEQQLARLRRAIDVLSPKLREVFVLVYVQGLSGTEAAKILEVKESAIWKRLHDARKRIAAELGVVP